jgi:hypothetical protein
VGLVGLPYWRKALALKKKRRRKSSATTGEKGGVAGSGVWARLPIDVRCYRLHRLSNHITSID